jgi:glycosyltransferase involved in cell wall biosynthesis
MRILIYNWKDPSHPSAGGAEVFTHEVATRWAAAGHEITLFCARYPGSPELDEIDGIRIVRRGGRLTVYRQAPLFWRSVGRGNFDVVIDEVNTRPFLTPRFVHDTPVVCLIHQLAAEVWQEEMPPVLSHIGRYVMEPRWLRLYRDIPTVTVSESTRSDLERLGFRNIRLVTEGCSVKPPDTPPAKEQTPTLLFVGRLVRTKRPDHAVRAHALVRKQVPNATLWLVGDGYMRSKLERMAAPGTHFFGHVDEAQKLDLMGRAHLLLMPGVREGWGLVVIEANARGTPAVGYDIPGLRDSIRDGVTGVIVEPDPARLAAAAVSLISEPKRLQELSRNASSYAETFSWDVTARDVLDLVEKRVR